VVTIFPGTALCAGFAQAIDSSQGNAIVTPSPRSTVLLEIAVFVMINLVVVSPRRSWGRLPLCREFVRRALVPEL
jgi:hypothetical protein